MDDRTDSSVCLGKEHLEVFVLVLRNIYRIGIKAFQHLVYSCTHYPVHWQGVYIRAVQLLYYGVLYFGPLAKFKAFGLC